MNKVVHQTMDPSGLWMEIFAVIGIKLGSPSWNELLSFWDNDFRWIFDPPLRPAQEVADPLLMTQRSRLRKTVNRSYAQLRKLPRWSPLDEVAYTAFTDAELNYLARHEVVDFGCGSGLLVAELLRRGTDAIGIDTDEFGLSSTNTFKWTHELRDQGRLIIDPNSIDRLKPFFDRTVTIIRPRGGEGWPSDALEALTAAGGQRFVFALWGPTKNQCTKAERHQQGQNMFRLLKLLCEHRWRQVSDHPGRPPFNPWGMDYNPWFFERNVL